MSPSSSSSSAQSSSGDHTGLAIPGPWKPTAYLRPSSRRARRHRTDALWVPVSCVEHGRWDGARSGEAFAPAPQTAYPELRHLKNRQARVAVEQNLEPRASQGDVWDEVAHKSERMATHSQTGAMHDIYDGRREQLAAFRDAVRLRDGQAGALVCIGGEAAVIDYVSRPDAFAALQGPLLQGYALDALEADAKDAGDPAVAQTFLDAALDARVSQRDGARSVGRGARGRRAQLCAAPCPATSRRSS